MPSHQDIRRSLVLKVHRQLIDADTTDSFAASGVLVSDRLPADLIRSLAHAESNTIRITLAQRCDVPDILSVLAEDVDPVVRGVAAKNDETPPDAVLRLLRDPDPDVRGHAHRHPAIPADWTFDDDDPWVRDCYARNPKASRVFLKAASLSTDSAHRLWAAQNSNTATDVLDRLAFDAAAHVRLAAAENPSTLSDTLRRVVAVDKDPAVLLAAAERISGDPVVDRLARHGDEQIRCVAASFTTDETIMHTLAADDCADVRAHVVDNVHAPAAVLAGLLSDTSSEVRDNIAWRSHLPAELTPLMATSPASEIRGLAASSRSATPGLLAFLASDPSVSVRRAVAKNRATSPETISLLTADLSLSVRGQAARHAACPPATLKALSSDLQMRDEALSHPSYPHDSPRPAHLVDALSAVDAARDSADADTLSELAQHRDTSVRVAVAGNLTTPVPTLHRLARDDEWTVSVEAALSRIWLIDHRSPEPTPGPGL